MARSTLFKIVMGVVVGVALASVGMTGCSGSSGADRDGPTGKDAGSTDQDAGSTDQDAGPTDQDAGPTDQDAGPEEHDAGPEEHDAGPAEPDGGPPKTCTEITLGTFTSPTHNGSVGVYTSGISPEAGDQSDADAFSFQLFGPGVDPAFNGDATGTFDLSQGTHNNYATCSRCLLVYQDPSVAGKWFFQSAGTLDIDAASKALEGDIKATLTDVTLIEVAIDPNTSASTPVPNGDCLHVTTASIELSTPKPPAGWACDPSYYADGSCDCGCGALDSDCADAAVGSCDYCDHQGSCSTTKCPGAINPTDNSTCTP